jgi:hypothetical protein
MKIHDAGARSQEPGARSQDVYAQVDVTPPELTEAPRAFPHSTSPRINNNPHPIPSINQRDSHHHHFPFFCYFSTGYLAKSSYIDVVLRPVATAALSPNCLSSPAAWI